MNYIFKSLSNDGDAIALISSWMKRGQAIWIWRDIEGDFNVQMATRGLSYRYELGERLEPEMRKRNENIEDILARCSMAEPYMPFVDWITGQM